MLNLGTKNPTEMALKTSLLIVPSCHAPIKSCDIVASISVLHFRLKYWFSLETHMSPQNWPIHVFNMSGLTCFGVVIEEANVALSVVVGENGSLAISPS